uniref:Uncharacterized protein n=1 Tax=Anguilla anguilla TaxID=7936 RepID=A0A0E9UZ94_ANGAN
MGLHRPLGIPVRKKRYTGHTHLQ